MALNKRALSAVLGLAVLAACPRAFCDDGDPDGDKPVQVGVSAVASTHPAGAGAEVSLEGQGKTGGIDPGYYSYKFSVGWDGGHPTGSVDYTYGYKDIRQTMVKGDVTGSNARVDVVGGTYVAHPFGDSGEFRGYFGLYGFQYNWALGGDGAMRALPLGVSYKQNIGEKVALKASVEHAFLLQTDQGNLESGKQSPTVQQGSGYNHDLEAALEGMVQVTPNLAITAAAVVEDTRYDVLKNANQPSQYFFNNGSTSVTGKGGVVVTF